MKQLCFIILIIINIPLYANWQMDSCLIRNGARDSVGWFSLNAISAEIVGKIYMDGSRYPGLMVKLDHWYPGLRYYKYVKHSTDGVPIFEYVSDIELPYDYSKFNSPTSILQIGDDIRIFWFEADVLYMATYDPYINGFIDVVSGVSLGLKFKPKVMYVEAKKFGFRIWYGAQDRWSQPVPGHWRKDGYFPYDGAGIWRGSFTYMGLYSVDVDSSLQYLCSPELVSPEPNEVLQSYCRMDHIDFGDESGIVTGSYMGEFYFYPYKKNYRVNKKKYIVDSNGNVIRHLGILASPVSYPSYTSTTESDIIATCEGGIYYYKYTGRKNERGNPVFDQASHLLEFNAYLYGGSLVVPTVVDWDGDGILDIIAGNSQGFILFFKNEGTDEHPRFIDPIYLSAEGERIHIQSGYKESIQGPLESRWGYTCPNVCDWDGDGMLDILFNDARGKHMILKGVNGPVQDRLKREHTLYLDGLDMHGTWRCRPGISEVDGEMMYITLDDQNELHMYKRIDDYNLEDIGKLKLKNGNTISATALKAGGTGRLKIEVVDWDGDGRKDLILGTCKYHYIPDSTTGIPGIYHNEGNKYTTDNSINYKASDVKLHAPVYYDSSPSYNPGATILFMKNVGSDNRPVYDFPKQFYYNGEKVKLGQHSVGVSAAKIGNVYDNLPNLVVADERGRFYLLERVKLSWN